MKIHINDSKKILFLIGPFGTGGAERVCVNLANSMSEIGHQIEILTLIETSPLHKKYLNPKIKFTSLNKRKFRNAALPLVSFFKRNQFDTVIVFNHYVGAGVVLLNKIFSLNLRIIVRSISSLTTIFNTLGSPFEKCVSRPIIKFALKSADAVIAQCEEMGQDLVEFWDVPIRKLAVINNPVATHFAENSGIAFKTTKKSELIFVGRLTKAKRIDLLLKAFKIFLNNHPTYILRLVGEGELRNQLENLVDQMGLSNNVIFQGFETDLLHLYAEAKVCVLTSEVEGFPNTLVEATTVGTPIVAFDCSSGPKEIVQNGINGYIVPFGNVDEFAEKLNLTVSKDWEFECSSYHPQKIVSQYANILAQ